MHLYNRFDYFLHKHVTVDHKNLYETIADNAKLSPTYLFLLTSATILATLGLLLDSSAVIIGSMVIAPFTWPILRIAYGIATADYISLFKGVRLLIVSICIMLVVSFVLVKLLPLTTLTDQITNRTAPTILDLIIALVAGAIAALTLFSKKISQASAGVAIAASLLPPMCVGGIGLALGIPDVIIGGILLSVTNIVAILFMATIILTSLIKTHAEALPIRRFGTFIVSILVVMISMPLFLLFSQYLEKVAQPDEKATVEKILTQEISGSFVESIHIDPDKIRAVILVKQGTSISPTIRQDIQRDLALKLRKEYNLNLHLVQELPVQ
jgi:uncharacterized hydrophobic protein (TIGR00271 family)